MFAVQSACHHTQQQHLHSLVVSGTQLVMTRQENYRTLVINIAIFKDGQTEAECRRRQLMNYYTKNHTDVYEDSVNSASGLRRDVATHAWHSTWILIFFSIRGKIPR